jgi:hypothetical protein
MLEDLPVTNIDVEHTQLSTQPSNAVVAMVAGGDHPPSMGSQERTSKINVVVQDTNDDDNKVLPWKNWEVIPEEAYNGMYRHFYGEYKDFDKHHWTYQLKIQNLEDKTKGFHTHIKGFHTHIKGLEAEIEDLKALNDEGLWKLAKTEEV